MRILQAAVIVMAVLIFVGLGVLVWGLFNLGSKEGGAPKIATGAAVPVAGGEAGAIARVSLGLPDGCEIADATASDRRIIVRTSCGELHIVDLRSLATLAVIGR